MSVHNVAVMVVLLIFPVILQARERRSTSLVNF